MPDLQTALTNAIHSKPTINATIDDWENHEQVIRQPQQEKVEEKPARGELNLRIFNTVKEKPNTYTSNELADHLHDTHGHNRGSALAAISQFVVAGMMARDDESRLHALVDEYTTLNAAYYKAMKNSPKAKRARAMAALEKAREARAANIAKRKKAAERAERKAAKLAGLVEVAPSVKAQGIAALKPEPTLPNLPTAESILNNMSIIEARKLYDELKKYFG